MKFLIILALLFLPASIAQAASFSCAKARSPDEKTICADAALSKQDDLAAASFAQAKTVAGAEAARSVARDFLKGRNACGADAGCIGDVIDRSITAYKALIAGGAPPTEQDKLYYGTRAGMQVTVTARSGIDSSNAVIRVEHRRADAIAFCRDYVQKIAEKCIGDELAVKLPDQISGNCETGAFETLSDVGMVFRGRNPSADAGDASTTEYIIVDRGTNEQLDGSMASGYPIFLEQFRALCPSRLR